MTAWTKVLCAMVIVAFSLMMVMIILAVVLAGTPQGETAPPAAMGLAAIVIVLGGILAATWCEG